MESSSPIVAACLITNGNLFRSKLTIFLIFRSLFWFTSRPGSGDKEIGSGVHGIDLLIRDGSNKSKQLTPCLSNINRSVENNSVEITAEQKNVGGEGGQDVESGVEMKIPLKIDVIRECWSEIKIT